MSEKITTERMIELFNHTFPCDNLPIFSPKHADANITWAELKDAIKARLLRCDELERENAELRAALAQVVVKLAEKSTIHVMVQTGRGSDWFHFDGGMAVSEARRIIVERFRYPDMADYLLVRDVGRVNMDMARPIGSYGIRDDEVLTLCPWPPPHVHQGDSIAAKETL